MSEALQRQILDGTTIAPGIATRRSSSSCWSASTTILPRRYDAINVWTRARFSIAPSAGPSRTSSGRAPRWPSASANPRSCFTPASPRLSEGMETKPAGCCRRPSPAARRPTKRSPCSIASIAWSRARTRSTGRRPLASIAARRGTDRTARPGRGWSPSRWACRGRARGARGRRGGAIASGRLALAARDRCANGRGRRRAGDRATAAAGAAAIGDGLPAPGRSIKADACTMRSPRWTMFASPIPSMRTPIACGLIFSVNS